MHDRNISSESTTEDDEIDSFAVLSQKVFCKFTIQAKGMCFLLQMEKKYLVEMIDLFKEIFVQLVSQEYRTLFITVRQKQKFIAHLNRAKKTSEDNSKHMSPEMRRDSKISASSFEPGKSGSDRSDQKQNQSQQSGLLQTLKKQLSIKFIDAEEEKVSQETNSQKN